MKPFHLPLHVAAQEIATKLGAAGLEHAQLLQLAKAAVARPSHIDRFQTMAERLYGGDWRAAGIKFLREEHILVRCLCHLKDTLDALDGWGFVVASERGRDHVLDVSKGNQRSKAGWVVRIPAGTHEGERQAAVEAALAQEGFRAASGTAAAKLLDQLATVSAG